MKAAPQPSRTDHGHRRPGARGGSRALIVSAAAVATACLAVASEPGYATPVATATARSGAFGPADEAGPHVDKPVISTPAHGSVIVPDQKSGTSVFNGTGQPGASLELYYRTTGSTDWKKLDSFSAQVGSDGRWKQAAPLVKAGLSAGIFDFRVRQTAEDRRMDSAPVTVTSEKDGVPCSPSAGFAGCMRFTYTGGDQSFVVPQHVRKVDARLWGAGGGSSDYADVRGGGGGGRAIGTVSVTAGQNLRAVVGAGGAHHSGRTYGGGGASGDGNNWAGSGGGMGALWDVRTPLLIAGGGGGAANVTKGWHSTVNAGGGGGGESGSAVPDSDSRQGGPGTQTSPGAAGAGDLCTTHAPEPGAKLQGGDGGAEAHRSGVPNGGGGGGGGWYGGGGGGCGPVYTDLAGGGGGGGAGYLDQTRVTDGHLTAGAAAQERRRGGAAAGTDDDQYTGRAGQGGGSQDNGSGGDGLVVIQWKDSAPTPAAAPASPAPRRSAAQSPVPGEAGTPEARETSEEPGTSSDRPLRIESPHEGAVIAPGRRLKVAGAAAPGARITLSLPGADRKPVSDQNVVTAGRDGTWQATLVVPDTTATGRGELRASEYSPDGERDSGKRAAVAIRVEAEPDGRHADTSGSAPERRFTADRG